MAVEYDLKLNHQITWQDFAVEKREPDQLAELKTICKDLFDKATQDVRYTQSVPAQTTGDPTELAEQVKKSLQLSTGDIASYHTLSNILGGNSPQIIIENLNNQGHLNGLDPWDIMRQIAEFQTSPDPSVLLSILGVNVTT